MDSLQVQAESKALGAEKDGREVCVTPSNRPASANGPIGAAGVCGGAAGLGAGGATGVGVTSPSIIIV